MTHFIDFCTSVLVLQSHAHDHIFTCITVMCMRKDCNLPARVDNVAKNNGKKAKNFLCDYSYKTQVGS